MYAINILQSEFLVQKSGCLFSFHAPAHKRQVHFFCCLHVRHTAYLEQVTLVTHSHHMHTHAHKTHCWRVKIKASSTSTAEKFLGPGKKGPLVRERKQKHTATEFRSTHWKWVPIYKSLAYESGRLVPCWLLCISASRQCSSSWLRGISSWKCIDVVTQMTWSK